MPPAATRTWIRRTASHPDSSGTALQKQWSLAAGSALKILVREEGWYRLMGSELIAAGLDSAVDPKRLQLFADGRQVPIRVTGRQGRRLDPGNTLEFYGLGLDTLSTDARVYCLQAGRRLGARIGYAPAARPKRMAPSSFPSAVEHRVRSAYFAALRNGDASNFFGELVAAEPAEVTLDVPHLDPAKAGEGQLPGQAGDLWPGGGDGHELSCDDDLQDAPIIPMLRVGRLAH